MAIDIFSTRAMVAALEERRPPKKFLTSTFFPTEETALSEYVDIDIIRHKRRLAPFVIPVLEGKLVEHQAHTVKTIRPPYLKPKMVTTAADILKRAFGQPVGGVAMKSGEQLAAEQLDKDLVELNDMVDRRIEWMAAQVLNAGTMDVVGEGVDVTIDFGFSASHKVTLSGGALWSATTATPIEDLRTWKRLAAKDSGIVPDTAVMGNTSVAEFLAHQEVKDLLNSRRNASASVDRREIPEGATYIGNVEGLDIYEYNEWYLDDAGAEQPMVPAEKVFLGSSRARNVVRFGAIQDVEAGMISIRTWPKSWTVPDPSARFVMLQSAPIVVPIQVDSFI